MLLTHGASHMINKIFVYLPTCHHLHQLFDFKHVISTSSSNLWVKSYFIDKACSNLTHGWQSTYNMLHVRLTFRFRRRISHDHRGVRLETICIHLRKVDSCVLTGTCEYDHGK